VSRQPFLHPATTGRSVFHTRRHVNFPEPRVTTSFAFHCCHRPPVELLAPIAGHLTPIVIAWSSRAGEQPVLRCSPVYCPFNFLCLLFFCGLGYPLQSTLLYIRSKLYTLWMILAQNCILLYHSL
jgi:hypothetical protein